MRLVVRAQNICGAPSDFILLGVEAKAEPEPTTTPAECEHINGADLEKIGNLAHLRPVYPGGLPVYVMVPILGDDAAKEWHVAITVRIEAIEPGRELRQEAEMEYDPRHLRWLSAAETAGRFNLTHLSWGGHNLLKKPGILGIE